jgi:hypothetical protein
MPNPRAQQPLSFDQIIKDAKSLGVPAQALLDALAGGVKGSVSATVGAPADIYNLLNQVSFRGQLPNLPYGSEDISKMLPDVVPTQDKSRQHSAEYGENMGSFIPTPMTGQTLKGAVKLGKAGARALGEEMGRRAVMGESFTPFVNTAIPQTHVVKPKGGNWFANEVENKLKGYKQSDLLNNIKYYHGPEFEKAREARIKELKEHGNEGALRVAKILEENIEPDKAKGALNQWVDKNLTNYVKKEMGTPDDPVRKLAEEGIVHKPFEDLLQFDKDELGTYRAEQGFPPEGLGKSPQAQAWENEVDLTFNIKKAKGLQELPEKIAKAELANAERIQAEANLNSKVAQYFKNNLPNLTEKDLNNLVKGLGYDEKERLIDDNTFSNTLAKLQKLTSFDDDYNLKRLQENPWVNKVAPDTNIYSAQTGGLGFDHILDVLKEDVASGRLRPESLKNVSMEQAVRRTYEYDQEMAKKMAEAQFKVTEGMPVHKEYPEGYKWIELTTPKKELPSGWSVKEALNPISGKQFQVFDENGSPIVGAYGKTEESALNSATKQLGRPELEKALQYEGETMGHCVGGYCPDVLEGRSRIYSLRDAKGEPHVTVEAIPQKHPIGYNRQGNQPFPEDFEYSYKKLPQEQHQAVYNRAKEIFDSLEHESPSSVMDAFQQASNEIIGEAKPSIQQIKGKQNLAPKEQYLPYVQDFVKSGNWSDVGDIKNTGLYKLDKDFLGQVSAYMPEAVDIQHLRQPQREEALLKAMEVGELKPGYITRNEYESAVRKHGTPTYGEVTDDLLNQLQAPIPPVEGMKKGGAVTISNNPDTMYMELMDRHLAGGGAITKLARALAKKPEEIRAIAERMAPQVTGEVSGVAGKSKKQFLHEKSLPIDIRVDTPMPDPEIVDLAKHKGKVMVGIKGDPTVTNQTLHKVGNMELESPAPQHGGPLYGQGKDVFWASGLGPAQGVQNLAKEASKQYNAPVLGNYVMMGPDSYYYAQHLADANLNAIAKSGMTEEQIEKLNELIRKGGPLSKGPRPNFETVSDIGNAYMQMQMDPKLRKHFNELMMKPTLSEEIGIPRGQDIAYAITEPRLRNLERGVTGHSIGEMRPDQPLSYSSHPTYSHDIPGSFLGTSSHPVPYELSFPDTVKAVRSVPKQARQEFGSFGMVGPRQIIDQQLIDELGEYQRQMKILTGKKKGGAIKKAKGGEISEDDIQMEVRPL